MEPVMREILNFEPLQEFVCSKDGTLPELIKDYYALLGGDLGYQVYKNFSVETGGINYGSISVAWLDSGKIIAGLDVEFGGKDSFLSSLWKLKALDSNNAVLITSSKAKNFSPEEAKKLVAQFHKKPDNFLILMDIAKEKHWLL